MDRQQVGLAELENFWVMVEWRKRIDVGPQSVKLDNCHESHAYVSVPATFVQLCTNSYILSALVYAHGRACSL